MNRKEFFLNLGLGSILIGISPGILASTFKKTYDEKNAGKPGKYFVGNEQMKHALNMLNHMREDSKFYCMETLFLWGTL